MAGCPELPIQVSNFRNNKTCIEISAELLIALVLSAALSSAVIAEETEYLQAPPSETLTIKTGVPATCASPDAELIFLPAAQRTHKKYSAEKNSADPLAPLLIGNTGPTYRLNIIPVQEKIAAKITAAESIRPPPRRGLL